MKSKNKHDHKLTNFLKVFIFMIIMLAPFFAIGVKCAYVINNDNAKDSYDENYVQSITAVDNTSQLQPGLTYYLTELRSDVNYSTYLFNYTSINIDWTEIFNAPSTYNYNGFKIENNTNGNDFLRLYVDGVQVWESHTGDYIPNLNSKLPFVFKLSSYTGSSSLNNYSMQLVTFFSEKLDYVFYKGVQELEEQETFNWTQNTMIYSAIDSMNTGLGVGTKTLSILLTYWTIITSIYIIIDIILEMFIFLTHWLNDKIC